MDAVKYSLPADDIAQIATLPGWLYRSNPVCLFCRTTRVINDDHLQVIDPGDGRVFWSHLECFQKRAAFFMDWGKCLQRPPGVVT